MSTLHGDRPRGGEPPLVEEVEREVEAHLALATEDLVREGWDPLAARNEARRRFGDVDVVRRQCERITRSRDRSLRRAQRGEGAMQDLRYALRVLVRSPGFTLVAVLTLALGIGANTAIFSVLNGVLLRPLPYEDPGELVAVWERNTRGGPMPVAWPNFRDWRAESASFEAITAYGAGMGTLVGGDEPVRVALSLVSEDFWRVFPVAPVRGRLTTSGDHQEGVAPVAVVSRGLAERALGGVDAVGRVVELGGTRVEIVGVVPSTLDFPDGAEAWMPIELEPAGDSRTAHNYRVVGRMREGAGLQALTEEVDVLTRRIIEASATASDAAFADYLATGAIVVPLHEELVGDARRPILLLLGAAAFVLLVACTNLASTLLARGTARAREFAVRSSLGAPRGRLVRQLLTESGVLAMAGAAAGIGLAALLMRVIRALGAESVPRIDGVGLDARVLTFALLVGAGTALVFGLLPAWRLTDGRQAGALRSGGRGAAGGRSPIWGWLVGTEVALALVLLVGAGLLVRSLGELTAQDRGFDDGDVLTSTLTLSTLRYPGLDDHRRFWDTLLPELEAHPDVAAAGVLSGIPMQGGIGTGRLGLDGDPDRGIDAAYLVATTGAFEALDVPLVRGRLFDGRDGPNDPHVVVVNEAFAERAWPGEDPLGRLVSGGGMDNYWNADPPVFGTVVGVVGDVRFRSLATEGEPAVYFHARQRPARLQWSATVVAEAASGDPTALAPLLRTSLREADADLVIELRTLGAVVGTSLAERRFVLTILGGFSVLGLALAVVGIYGVVAYTVALRTREIGVRLALGASPTAVRRRVLAGALGTVSVGLVAGVAGALLLTRLLQGFLFGVSATDPATFAAMAAVLLAAASLASWIPARRSTRVDPIITMRAE